MRRLRRRHFDEAISVNESTVAASSLSLDIQLTTKIYDPCPRPVAYISEIILGYAYRFPKPFHFLIVVNVVQHKETSPIILTKHVENLVFEWLCFRKM